MKPRRSWLKPITCGTETRTIFEWARLTGLPVTVLRSRLISGWPADRALMTPYKYQRPPAT